MNNDWAALCAIYGGDETVVDDAGNVELTHSLDTPPADDDRNVRLVASKFSNGFCGTVYMTLSTTKVAFARRVDDAGNYRYFELEKSPELRLDFLYRQETSSRDNEDSPESEIDDSDCFRESPSSVRLLWEHYPGEWPKSDKVAYRTALSKMCNTLLQEEGMSFVVCEFLEHQGLSFYKRSSDFDDGWKNYVDPNHPDFQLIILPPEMDRMYHKTKGTLIHPQHEAAAMERTISMETMERKKIKGKSSRRSVDSPSIVRFQDTMEFGRHALIHFWKELYSATCPICLDDSVLFSEGIVLPYCQHYSCRDCFQTYLQHKVQDLKQHRTNPFVCPVESCKRELPIVGYCKQHLSAAEMESVRSWYRDLKNPPCWSLDRCLYTKTCGAIGSMRRRKSSIPSSTNKVKHDAVDASYEAHLVYCEACMCMFCELCLKRVYDEDDKTSTRSNPFNHRWHCQPEEVVKFCRKYRAASKDIQEKCQERYPWIQSYSLFCQHDGEALQYVLENGQRCPNCQTGVERIEGCFHMKCPTCATHFCYECGTELFPPYYGTHHCWLEEEPERNNITNREDYVTDTDEQYALALYLEEAI